MSATPEEDLLEALRLARRELKLARTKQEAAEEGLQRVRRERATLRKQVVLLADTLAQLLADRYWADRPGGIAARLRRDSDSGEERAAVAEVEASDLFDGGWYLRQHPDAVRERLSPAVHYVRTGAETGADPGPTFDTKTYLEEHPDACGSHLPALVHRLRRGNG